MDSRLQQEIRQARPFRSLEQEALLSIGRTAARTGHAMVEALRPHGITPTQYNVLRILRGAGEEGLCRNEVRERMIALVPDVTRLLDRLEEAGLIRRHRDQEDRRQMRTRITAEGLELLASLDEPVDALDRSLLGHLSEAELRDVIRLLARVRSGLK
jgi:DNA-binding MarR family transcriptional regulator